MEKTTERMEWLENMECTVRVEATFSLFLTILRRQKIGRSYQVVVTVVMVKTAEMVQLEWTVKME